VPACDGHDVIAGARRLERGQVEILDLQTEPACWRAWTTLSGSREVLRPDLYLAVAVGNEEVRWFIEVDRGTEHRPALSRKAAAYQRYYDSQVEQDRDGVFPKVVWVVPNDERRSQLHRALDGDPTVQPGLFAVTTADEAAAYLLT
jgi:hypothetical protein